MIVLHNSNLTVFSFSTLRILLYSFLASIVATENFAVSLIAIFFFGVFYFFFLSGYDKGQPQGKVQKLRNSSNRIVKRERLLELEGGRDVESRLP